MEVELKLALDPAAEPALRAHALLAHYVQQPPRTQLLVNHYHDTPQADLWRTGVDLRLRRAGSGHVQTLKALERAHGALHRRREWEAPVAAPALDVAALLAMLPVYEARLANRLRAIAARADFGPQVATHIRRTTWQLRSAAGDEVELVLDVGHAGLSEAAAARAATRASGQGRGRELAEPRRVPICEVELELKAGRESALFELAAALQKTLPLRPELRGKAERGFALLLAQPVAAPRHAAAVPLDAAGTWPRALRLIVEECLAQVQANEAGVIELADAEYVHQMRVGLRRLRSVLGLFTDLTRPPPELLAELGRSAEQLGRARDAQVLALETLPRVPAPVDAAPAPATDAAGGEEPSAAALVASWVALRHAACAAADAARQQAVLAVRDARHVAWQLELMRWITDLDADAAADADGDAIAGSMSSLAEVARRALRRLRKRVLARAKPLQAADSNASQRHELRIAAKKLRYAIELLGAVPGTGARARGTRALAAMQQQLGLLNDAEVGSTRLGQLAREQPATAAAAAYAMGWLAADAGHRVRRLGRLWRRVRAEL